MNAFFSQLPLAVVFGVICYVVVSVMSFRRVIAEEYNKGIDPLLRPIRFIPTKIWLYFWGSFIIMPVTWWIATYTTLLDGGEENVLRITVPYLIGLVYSVYFYTSAREAWQGAKTLRDDARKVTDGLRFIGKITSIFPTEVKNTPGFELTAPNGDKLRCRFKYGLIIEGVDFEKTWVAFYEEPCIKLSPQQDINVVKRLVDLHEKKAGTVPAPNVPVATATI